MGPAGEFGSIAVAFPENICLINGQNGDIVHGNRYWQSTNTNSTHTHTQATYTYAVMIIYRL